MVYTDIKLHGLDNFQIKEKNVKLWSKLHFVKNKTDYSACLIKVVIFLVA